MSAVARAYTFTDGTDAYGSQVESELNTIFNAWNNHDAGTSSWTLVKAVTVNATSALQLNGLAFVFTDWAAYTPTFVGLGTVSNTAVYWRQVGSTIFVRGYTKCGVVSAAPCTITLPNSTVINTSHIPGSSAAQLGIGYQLFSAAGPTNLSAGLAAGPLMLFSDGSDTTHVFVTMRDASSVFNKDNGNTILLANDGFSFEFSYPI